MKKSFESKIMDQLEDLREKLVKTVAIDDTIMWELNATITGIESAIMHWRNVVQSLVKKGK